MFDDFMVRAILMLVMLSCLTAPLGSVAVWRRMSYFGDAASHAALLGVAVALVTDISPIWGALAMALFIGIVLGSIDDRKQSSDGMLGVLAHGGLAGALVITAFMGERRGNLEGFMFGDVLNTSKSDLLEIFFIGIVILAILAWRWKNILVSTLNPELASAQGVNSQLEKKIYAVLLALTVAVAMKAVGALLVGALLIIPALSARRFVRNPEGMVLMALIATWIASFAGFWGSYHFDLPTGASIVMGTVVIFLLSNLRKAR